MYKIRRFKMQIMKSKCSCTESIYIGRLIFYTSNNRQITNIWNKRKVRGSNSNVSKHKLIVVFVDVELFDLFLNSPF